MDGNVPTRLAAGCRETSGWSAAFSRINSLLQFGVDGYFAEEFTLARLPSQPPIQQSRATQHWPKWPLPWVSMSTRIRNSAALSEFPGRDFDCTEAQPRLWSLLALLHRSFTTKPWPGLLGHCRRSWHDPNSWEPFLKRQSAHRCS